MEVACGISWGLSMVKEPVCKEDWFQLKRDKAWAIGLHGVIIWFSLTSSQKTDPEGRLQCLWTMKEATWHSTMWRILPPSSPSQLCLLRKSFLYFGYLQKAPVSPSASRRKPLLSISLPEKLWVWVTSIWELLYQPSLLLPGEHGISIAYGTIRVADHTAEIKWTGYP